MSPFLLALFATFLASVNGCQNFQCGHGYARRPSGHPANVNGCGPEDYPRVSEALSKAFTGFVEMCNNHDRCYGMCGAPKEWCDNVFWEEMVKYCESWRRHTIEFYRDCMTLAHTYAEAVNIFGCSAYTKGQRKACICVRSRSMWWPFLQVYTIHRHLQVIFVCFSSAKYFCTLDVVTFFQHLPPYTFSSIIN